MIDFRPNSAATIYLTYRDGYGKGVTGATMTVSIVGPAGTTLPASSINDDGDGLYHSNIVAANLSQIGTYRATWTVTAPESQVFVTLFTVGYEGAYPETLQSLRHAVSLLAEGQEGFLQGEVESATATSITDPDRLEMDNSLRGWNLFVYAGTARGQRGRLTASTSAGVLTVGRAFGVTPVAGDLYEVHRHFEAEEINRAIQAAIEEVQDRVTCPISDASTVLSSSTYEYDIPPGFSHVFALDAETSAGLWEEITPAGWRVLQSIRKVQIDWDLVGAYDGCKLRFRGFRYAQVPFADDQGVDVRPAFVKERAAARLCATKLGGRGADAEGWQAKTQLHEALAETERARLIRRYPPNNRRVD